MLRGLEEKFNPRGLTNDMHTFGSNFRAIEVEGLIWLHLGEAETIQRFPPFDSAREYVRRKLQLLESLEQHLKDSDSDRPFVSEALTRARHDSELIEAAALRDVERRKRLGLKCRTASDIVTDLMTYFERSRDFLAHYESAATRYKLVGEIVTMVSHPNCLACGNPHPFSSYQAVRARDRQRDEVRRNRSFLFEESLARFKDLIAPDASVFPQGETTRNDRRVRIRKNKRN